MPDERKRITLDDLKSHQSRFEERIAYNREIVARVVVPDGIDGDLFRQCLELAAGHVAFDPQQVVQRLGASPAALDSLFDVSVRSSSFADENKWQLQGAVRKRILKQLKEQSRLEDILKSVSVDNTLDQRVFNGWMSGTLTDSSILSREEVVATLRVYDMLDEIVELPSKDRLACQLERLNCISTLKELAEGQFAGRTAELDRLRKYVWKSDTDRPLLVHGPGGMGKSTLLAEFLLREVIKKGEPACPFAYLDFDRRSLSIEYPVTLLYEALWQFAAFYPEHRRSLLALRDQWRSAMSANADLMSNSLESAAFSNARQTGAFVHEFLKSIPSFGQVGMPLLIILDTFEEVQARSSDYVIELFSFLQNIQFQLKQLTAGPSQLRVILSGRVPVPDFPNDGLPLAELDRETSKKFLIRLGVAPSLSQRITSQIRGVPLTLRLAANVIKSTQDELLSQGEFDAMHPVWYELRDEQIQGLIYQRYLQQIHDVDVRKLAHPGLVLRRITPEIIENVLADPCGVVIRRLTIGYEGKVAGRTAQELFDAMAREVSLVSQDIDGELRHRPELRTVMLELLQQNQRTRAKKIHRNAVAYYEGFDDVKSRAEEIYHRLQLEHSEATISKRWKAGIESFLRDSINELPLSSRTIIASYLGSDTYIEGHEASRQESGQATWERYAERRAARLIKLNKPDDARKVLEERKQRLAGSALFELEVSVRKHAADWDGMRDVAMRGINSAAEAGDRKLAYRLAQQLVRAVLLSGEFLQGREILANARRMVVEGDSPEQLAYHLELDLAEISMSSAQVNSGASTPWKPLERSFSISIGIEWLYDNASKRLNQLVDRTRARQYAGIARSAAGVLHAYRADFVQTVMRRFGLFDGQLNKPAKRLLCRACITWDEIVSANLRRPSGVLANGAELRLKSQSLEDAWKKAIDQRDARFNEIVYDLIDRFGLPVEASRRFAEFFQLPSETELFAPVHTKLLEQIDFEDLRELASSALGTDLDLIGKGSDKRDVVRQLVSWTYENGRFQELIEAARSTNKSRLDEPTRLDSSEIQEFVKVLLSCYPNTRAFEAMLQRRLDTSLRQYSSVSGGLEETIMDVVLDFNRRSKISSLVKVAVVEHPNKNEIAKLAERLNIARPGSRQKSGSVSPSGDTLLIDAPATYVDIESWHARRAAFESTICLFEVERDGSGTVFGTGFLVGPDIVLTCRTLVEGSNSVTCRFGYRLDQEGNMLEGISYRVDADWRVAEGSTEEFDYVLVRISGAPGKAEIKQGGRTQVRGWIQLLEDFEVSIGDGTYLLHHPNAGPLQFAFSERSIITAEGTRLTYKCATSPGSMGAPIVSSDWSVIAVHQGKDADGVAFGLSTKAILSDLQQNGNSTLLNQRFEQSRN